MQRVEQRESERKDEGGDVRHMHGTGTQAEKVSAPSSSVSKPGRESGGRSADAVRETGGRDARAQGKEDGGKVARFAGSGGGAGEDRLRKEDARKKEMADEKREEKTHTERRREQEGERRAQGKGDGAQGKLSARGPILPEQVGARNCS